MNLREFHWLAPAILLVWATYANARAEDAPSADSPVPKREIHVRVLGLNGKPTAHRHVQLWGVSRSGLRDDGEKIEPNWDFYTDEAGRCVVRLADGKWDDAGSLPGWGTYAMRAVPGPDDAGAFSPYLIHEEDAWTRKEELRDRRNLEWGRPLIVARTMELTLHIEPGFTIRGRVLRYPSRRPWPETEVSSAYNLYAESHTGYGAEIRGPSAKTDVLGRFTLRHVYPSKLFLEASGAWVQTKRDHGPWVMDALDRIEPARHQSAVFLQIATTTEKPFRVFGHVQDAAHRPLAGAQVTVGSASHRHPYRWHEAQYEHVATDADGNYEVRLEHPWVMELWIGAGEHHAADYPGSDEGTARFQPGRYDFTLK